MPESTTEIINLKCDDSATELGGSCNHGSNARCLAKEQDSSQSETLLFSCRRHAIIVTVPLCIVIVSALAVCIALHHSHVQQSAQFSISLTISDLEVELCDATEIGGLLRRVAVAASDVLSPRLQQQQPPCMTKDRLMMTDKDTPLGPLVCDDDSSYEDFKARNCQRPGFRLTENRDGVTILQAGTYVTQSSVTFLDSDHTNFATSSVTVNGKIRLDCALHSAHNGSKNPFSACRLIGLLRLNRGDIVRFQVRRSGRLINPHGPATYFFMYRLV